MAGVVWGSYKRRVMHLATPRTLLFLERDGLWLFLRGAPSKWFAGRLNGLGGSVEPGEGVLAAARRECVEETGLPPVSLRLAAVVHTVEDPPVLIFVCVGALPVGQLRPTPEGEHVWLPADALDDPGQPFVPDLRALFPRATGRAAHAASLSFVLRPPDDLVEDAAGAGPGPRVGSSALVERFAEGGREPMPTTLHHCVQTPLPQPGPCDVHISSAQGPGTVDVTGPGGVPVHGSVAVPGGGVVHVPSPGPIEVHYRRGKKGPESIEVEIEQHPA